MRRTAEAPKRRTRRCVPDQPGAMPRPVSGRPSLIPVSATRMSATAASSSPPPKAWPVSAAISGTRNRASASKARWPSARPVAPHVERRQPAPGGDVAAGAERLALAARESPRASRAESSIARAASASASIIARSSALSLSARFSVMRAIGPVEGEIDVRAHRACSMAGRNVRPKGSGRNSAASIVFRSSATRSGKCD